jgi:type II secretory pathway component PulJ
MKNRKGFSLIELTINLSAASMLMLLAVSAVHSVMTIRTITSGLVEHHKSVARLSLQLRRDVHSAEVAKVGDENVLQLQLAHQEMVEYRIVPGAIVRTASGAKLEDSDNAGHERFELRESTEVEISLSQDARIVELAIWRNSPSRAEPKLMESKIRAVVGLWQANSATEQQ